MLNQGARRSQLALLVGAATLLFAACATMSPPSRVVEELRTPDQPKSIHAVQLSRWNLPSSQPDDAGQYGEPFTVNAMMLSEGLSNITWFSAEELAYITKMLADVTTRMRRFDLLELRADKHRHLRIGFVKDAEWESLLGLVGARDSTSAGASVVGALLAVGDVGSSLGKSEQMEVFVNRQGTNVKLRRIKTDEYMVAGFGYVHTGTPIKPENAKRLLKNTTTRDEAKQLLGEPSEIKILRNGSVVWLYEYRKFGRSPLWGFVPLGNLKSPEAVQHEILELMFRDEILRDYNYSKIK